ncbi:DUF5681 domain-containing protein [Albibacillus kandeliae]|uniref:DUF5681 domain-containing protein n=1 Tax=Albibacillus kandeliae TaxID=2174228 RepID=UPI000D68C169|nr:DUF5681 domain-containing protein [Albibacillus kandeliae]
MSDKSKKPDDYGVGYAKPPKHTQWQKGQSGNPAGKKTKSRSVTDAIRQVLQEEILVNHNGSTVTMTNLEALIRSLLSKALKGDVPCMRLLFHLVGMQSVSDHDAATFELTDADLAVLESHAEWKELVDKAKAEFAAASSADIDQGGGAANV